MKKREKKQKTIPLRLVSRMPAHLSDGTMQGLHLTWHKLQKGDRIEALTELSLAIGASKPNTAFVPYWKLLIGEDYIPALKLVVRRNILDEIVRLRLSARGSPEESARSAVYGTQQIQKIRTVLLNGLEAWSVDEQRVGPNELELCLVPQLGSDRFVNESDELMKRYRKLRLEHIEAGNGTEV